MSDTLRFRIAALPAEEFAPLFHLSDAELASRGIRRKVADSKPGFPCRVSLQDAEVGETVLLLPYEHHRTNSPYRGSGPIYVRERAVTATPAVNEVPEYVAARLLSVRGYDSGGMLVAADVTPGRALAECVGSLFSDGAIAYLHVHNAKPGCYSCRIERA